MLDMRFAGRLRFIAGAGSMTLPDNFDAPIQIEAAAMVGFATASADGVHWTGHKRPPRPKGPARSRKYLKLVK